MTRITYGVVEQSCMQKYHIRLFFWILNTEGNSGASRVDLYFILYGGYLFRHPLRKSGSRYNSIP